MNFIKSIIIFLARKPAPSFIVSLILSIRYKCRVSFGADINFPWNVKIGRGANIGKCLIIATGDGIEIGSNVSIGYGAVLDALGGHIYIANHSALGPYVVVYGQGGVKIGSYCMLATQTTLVASNHIYSSVELPIKLQGTKSVGIDLGDDVWLGANVVVQDGVTLGNGVIVGSSALVRTSFSDYSIVAGIPAKILHSRVL